MKENKKENSKLNPKMIIAGEDGGSAVGLGYAGEREDNTQKAIQATQATQSL